MPACRQEGGCNGEGTGTWPAGQDVPQDWASRQALEICFWPSLQHVCFKISFHLRNFEPRDVPSLFEKLKGILPNSRIVAPASLPPMPGLDNELGQGMWHGKLEAC